MFARPSERGVVGVSLTLGPRCAVHSLLAQIPVGPTGSGYGARRESVSFVQPHASGEEKEWHDEDGGGERAEERREQKIREEGVNQSINQPKPTHRSLTESPNRHQG
jgi:hypothetical protein